MRRLCSGVQAVPLMLLWLLLVLLVLLVLLLLCRWEPLMGIVAAGLVPLMQESLTQGLVELAMHVLSTASVSDFVTAALQVSLGDLA